MALSLDRQYKGLAVPSAYVEIVGVRIAKEVGCVYIDVTVHTQGKAHSLEKRCYDAPYTSDATVEWAYNQLKTLPEFADAVDV